MYGFETGEWAPVGTREEFMGELADLVRAEAPSLFALCEEFGECFDGEVRYWGLAFEDRAEVVSANGSTRGRFNCAQSAHRVLTRGRTLHLMWT